MKSIESPNILSTFQQLGSLIKGQKKAASNFDSGAAYGDGNKHGGKEGLVINYYIEAFKSMSIGDNEYIDDWSLNLDIDSSFIIDQEKLYSNLRLLPNEDIRKVRLFNRFAGQQCFNITATELYSYEERRDLKVTNRFFDTYSAQVTEFAELNGVKIEKLSWPTKAMDSEQRKAWTNVLEEWREKVIILPGIKETFDRFSGKDDGLFNAFFHSQRQFDSETWKDTDENGEPFPQPLSRIAGYRALLTELDNEFNETESNISMCFDYCRMSKNRVVGFVLNAEDSFLNIVTKLDDEYPKDIDFAHALLHSKANEVKQMMFPLRCLFFQELEEQRGVKDSVDNTLDSYMDMTLGKKEINIPSAYDQFIKWEDLDVELMDILTRVYKGALPHEGTEAKTLINIFHNLSEADMEAFANEFDKLCDVTEEKYKEDENNQTRRIARVSFLYLKAFTQKQIMADASQQRLDSIQNLAEKYSGRAAKFESVDIEDDKAIRNIKEDELPMMASPEQLEDLYRTQKIVQRLSDSESEFQDTANEIDAGLQAAVDMMKKAESFMTKIVQKMFPSKEDSKDLLSAIKDLIELSYKTQTLLADLTKIESRSTKLDEKTKKKVEKMKADLESYKSETADLQVHLKEVLAVKNELVTKMRIMKDEKEQYFKNLRMITIMTINSMQAQGQES